MSVGHPSTPPAFTAGQYLLHDLLRQSTRDTDLEEWINVLSAELALVKHVNSNESHHPIRQDRAFTNNLLDKMGILDTKEPRDGRAREAVGRVRKQVPCYEDIQTVYDRHTKTSA